MFEIKNEVTINGINNVVDALNSIDANLNNLVILFFILIIWNIASTSFSELNKQKYGK
tara:strand:+ start:481 stop:654 length:174 start_codon:yes stop_codon:yes gene_type:complete